MKRMCILLLVFILVFSFALTVFADSNDGATVDLEEGKLYVPQPAKENASDHTPPANNPIDVAGA